MYNIYIYMLYIKYLELLKKHKVMCWEQLLQRTEKFWKRSMFDSRPVE